MATIEKKNIAVYGSCITKDPFTTLFNKNYKQRYNCLINDQKHTFISTMQEKEKCEDSELILLPDNSANRFLSRCIKEDIEKTFIDLMLENEIDYLVIDINFEVENGIICFNGGKKLTKITDFDKTEYYNKLNDIEIITLKNNPDKYFEMWKESCNAFFEFLEKNCPKTKIILAEVRALDIVQRSDLSTYIEPNFTITAKIHNFYFKKLENYIKENFDVRVIKFNKDIVLNENHVWGKYYVHYTDEYYSNFLEEVNKIVEYDELQKKLKILSLENAYLKKKIKSMK